ncbi:MAG: hypothetical protein OXC71_10080 [Chloroflexi bacterium]|nr:hypothetical protein [Chloroflexota bacterium]
MDLLYLIDRLEEQVAGAQRMPIGNRAVLDRRELLDTIDQLRVAVPSEVREAREIVEEMDAIRRNTEEEARLMLARAEEQAATALDDHKLTRAARERAAEIVAEAEVRAEERAAEANAEMAGRIEESRVVARQQMAAADEYARQLLTKLEYQLRSFERSVQSGLEQLSASPAEAGAQPAVSPAQMDAFLADAAAAPRSLGEAERRVSGDIGSDPIDFTGLDHRDTQAQQQPEPVAPDEGVIDDFAMPPLDDERTRFEVVEPTAEREPIDKPEPERVEEPAEERETAAPAAGAGARGPANGTS